MSQNDVLSLESNFKIWCKARANGLQVQPFLYYCVEQVLKPYNLRDEDILYGITDHPNDGGIDAIYFLINRNIPVRDDLDVASSGVTRIRLVIIQAKSSERETGFKAADVDKFIFFTDELLDLSQSDASRFAHKYQKHLVTIMQTFKDKYLQVGGTFPEVEIEYYYITKADETVPGPATDDSIQRLEVIVKKHMRDARFTFHAINTQRLLDYVKKRRQTTRILKWARHPPLPIADSYLGVVKMSDYFSFLKDESGSLDELIFESNVRGYQQNTPVNRQIRKTLENKSSVDFWLLNNGVTIISGGGKLQPVDAMTLSN